MGISKLNLIALISTGSLILAIVFDLYNGSIHLEEFITPLVYIMTCYLCALTFITGLILLLIRKSKIYYRILLLVTLIYILVQINFSFSPKL